ncbi:CD99 molecule isoform X2 [Kryptolebias marmoratus]|uniref:CD99 molecule n=1 Tax=Kryptolebias marmoratus TaxID=37003 RepID=A0A3Q3AKN3_KRYMA|nr:CD99 molecule isoform X2 [Kryptolebias marmoratus]
MKFCLGTLLLLFLVPGSSTQDGFDLADAFDDVVTPPPKLQPKPPEKPKTDGELDLSDAFGPDDPATEKPKKPSSGGFDDFRFDLEDALKPDPNAKTDKPAIVPPKGGGGGGTFDDSDLFEVGAGDYKPDGGRSGNRANDPESDTQDRTNDPGSDTQGSGPMAGIISAIGVALVGAASSYFAYQKKKLCFKIQGGQDPESGKGQPGTHSEPQVFSNLLQSDRT